MSHASGTLKHELFEPSQRAELLTCIAELVDAGRQLACVTENNRWDLAWVEPQVLEDQPLPPPDRACA